MNIRQIANKVKIQLEKMKFGYTKFNILETKWGYVIQTNYNNNSYISLFDDNGKMFFPFTKTKTDSGIYRKYETMEDLEKMESIYEFVNIEQMIEEDKRNHPNFFNLYSYQVDLNDNISLSEEIIFYRELDDKYFIIPILLEDNMVALFYVDDNDKLLYCENIAGEIYNLDNKLIANKILLIKNKDRETMYSWKNNKVISDTWDLIKTSPFNIEYQLFEIKNMLPELVMYFVDFIEQHKAFLGILDMKSKDSLERMQFFAVIGSDGIAITDLMYITNTYEIKSIKLRGEQVGTLDKFRIDVQNRLDQRALIRKNNQMIAAKNISMLIENRRQYDKLENSDFLEEDNLTRNFNKKTTFE